ncbi:DoxX family protein [Fulvivirga kasyanovii]|uniref:DoxX family protein n=1 Tax=Fulvivirga kasyanovii TaxID=396812 RepID=A0ABW9RYE3_9BACT|nr:DoxX family protein [Fulvivirga kasyanovii]MTI28810.1 DoxX family protein [Fulvivirga kasyanovii]
MKRKNIDLGLLILRLSLGLLMLLHGIAKLVHGIEFIKSVAGVFAYGVYIGEILAPIAIVLGFRTRIASAVYVLNCLVAIVLVHSSEIFKLNEFGGWANELLGLYLFGALTLFFTGAGKYALSKNNLWD